VRAVADREDGDGDALVAAAQQRPYARWRAGSMPSMRRKKHV
jgi:hypothetical protein